MGNNAVSILFFEEKLTSLCENAFGHLFFLSFAFVSVGSNRLISFSREDTIQDTIYQWDLTTSDWVLRPETLDMGRDAANAIMVSEQTCIP